MTEKQLPRDITLSVVDQSPLRKGAPASESLLDTVALAREVEEFGYARYWVAEHHNSTSSTGNAPEILIGQIAANTSTIRVGSGGVMLPHYSALKVAEQFRTLNAFYPGRIDLGIGRAPGSDQRTALALTYPRPPADVNRFPQMVSDLIDFLEDGLTDDHPFAGIKAQAGPTPSDLPEVWLLGSSDFSARLAGMLGLPFAFADFFGTTGSYGPAVAHLYREHFKPSKYIDKPKLNVTVQALCAPTDDEARFIASSRNLAKAAQHLGLNDGVLPPEEAVDYPLTEVAKQYIESLTPAYVDGSPERVRSRIVQLAADYGTSDIGIVTNCYHHEHRVRSYRLIADAFELA